MSGNGAKIAHQGLGFSPSGNGGGCVTSGPFKKFVFHRNPLLSSFRARADANKLQSPPTA
jgi:hypothetical protein